MKLLSNVYKLSMAKIYTKMGDTGMTRVMSSKDLIPKSDLLIETEGAVDNLGASIGFLVALLNTPKPIERTNSTPNNILNDSDSDNLLEFIRTIQSTLFTVGAILTTGVIFDQVLLDSVVNQIEQQIDQITQNLQPLTNFIYMGHPGQIAASYCHVVRTVCRETERRVTKLYCKRGQNPVLEPIIKFLNRLSDYWFILARKLSQDNSIPDQIWRMPTIMLS